MHLYSSTFPQAMTLWLLRQSSSRTLVMTSFDTLLLLYSSHRFGMRHPVGGAGNTMHSRKSSCPAADWFNLLCVQGSFLMVSLLRSCFAFMSANRCWFCRVQTRARSEMSFVHQPCNSSFEMGDGRCWFLGSTGDSVILRRMCGQKTNWGLVLMICACPCFLYLTLQCRLDASFGLGVRMVMT